MKTKTNAKRVPAKDAISRVAAEAAYTRVSEMSGPHEERFITLCLAILDQCHDGSRREAEMARAAGIPPLPAQLLCVLGEMIAVRRLSTAQLFELGSSEEAMQLCTEALARGLREPAAEAGKGHVLRFPRFPWVGDPLPKEAPPVKEDEKVAGTEDAGA